MTKERRAFGTLAIEDTAPTESLEVSQRGAMDYTQPILAENARAGVWFNPEVFKDLASISSTIHDTRRSLDNSQFSIDYTAKVSDNELYIKQKQAERILAADTEIANILSVWQADALDDDMNARRTGSYLSPVVDNRDAQRRSYIDKLAVDNPYMATKLEAHRQSMYASEAKNAFNLDASNEVLKAKFQADTTFRANSAQVAAGVTSLDSAIQNSANTAFPLLFTMDASKAPEDFNNHYNSLILAEAERISLVAKELGDVQGGKAALATLLANYMDPRVISSDVNGEARSVTCSLAPETVKSILSMTSTLSSSKNDLKIKTSYEAYKQLVESPDYYTTATYGSIEQDIQPTIDKALAAYEATQDSQHLNTVNGALKTFWDKTYPTTSWYSMARAMKQGNKDANEIKTTLTDILNQLREARDLGTDLEEISALKSEDSSGLFSSYFGLPDESNTLWKLYMDNTPDDPRLLSKNFLNQLITTGESFLKDFNADKLIKLDTGFNHVTSAFENAFSYEALVTEDRAAGIVQTNLDGLGRAKEAAKNREDALSVAAGNNLTPTTGRALLDVLSKNMEGRTVEQQVAYISSAAEAIRGTSDASAVINSLGGSKVPDNQKVVFENFQTAVLLNNGDNTLRGYARDVDIFQKQNAFKKVTAQDLNAVKSRFALSLGSVDEQVEDSFKRNGIPFEQRPALRNAIYTVLAAESSTSIYKERGDKNVNVRDVADKIVTSNFQNGAYKYSKIFINGDMTPDIWQSINTKTTKVFKDACHKSGLKDTNLKAEIDPETSQVRFMNNGEEVMGIGKTASMARVGKIPLRVDLSSVIGKYSTADIEKGLSGYTTGLGLLISGGYTDQQQTARDAYAKIFKKDMSVDNYATLNTQLLAEASKPEAFAAYMEYINNPSKMHVEALGDSELNQFMTMNNLYKLVPTSDSSKSGNVRGTLQYDPFVLKKEADPEVVRFLNFVNTRRNNGKTMSMDIPKEVLFESNGVPYNALNAGVDSKGWRITSTFEGKHADGSLHYSLNAVDVAPKGRYGKILDRYGHVNLDKYDTMAKYYESLAKDGQISRVLVGHPEIAQKYKNVKNKDGKSLFYYPAGNADLIAQHQDHDHVEFYSEIGGLRKMAKGDPLVSKALTVKQLQKDYGSKLSSTEAKACVRYFNNFSPDAWDANNTGRSLAQLNSSNYTKISAGTKRYLRVKNAMGSSEAAIALMNGAKFSLNYTGNKVPDKVYSGLETVTEIEKLRARGLVVHPRLAEGSPKHWKQLYVKKFIGG